MNINPPIDMGNYDISVIETSVYGNGKLAVQAFCSDGELACTISVNLPEQAHLLENGEFFLKAYSENAKSVAKLIERGIVVVVTDKPAVRTGFVVVPIARLAIR